MKNHIKGFLIYLAIVTTVALAVFINWLEKKDDEKIGYESGRYEQD